MNKEYANKVTYFRGDAVLLSGKVIILHGATFCEGIYTEGHRAGESVLIEENTAKMFMVQS